MSLDSRPTKAERLEGLRQFCLETDRGLMVEMHKYFQIVDDDAHKHGFKETDIPYLKDWRRIHRKRLDHGAGTQTEEELKSHLLSLYKEKFYPGESTGWWNLDELIRVEKSQLNILTGIPSHGKSSWMDALLVNLADRSGWKVAVFSPENKTHAYHASKFIEIISGKSWHGENRITEEEVGDYTGFVNQHFSFISSNSGKMSEVLLEIERACPDIAVIDPWNRLDHSRPSGMSETEYIGQTLSKCSYMAKQMDISLWIVAHPQKLRRDKNGNVIRPGLYEISGSAHWANMTDNAVIVWRDFKNNVTEIETAKVRYRHNGKPGIVFMMFNRSCGQFTPITKQQIEANDFK